MYPIIPAESAVGAASMVISFVAAVVYLMSLLMTARWSA
jgi:hypothetical protein